MSHKLPDSPAEGVTTAEIARLCGVSRSTVSAVLNGKAHVRESTRRKVLERVRQCNYQSGVLSRSLIGKLSRMVAILTPSVGNPFHLSVFQGINAALETEGYHILFHHVPNRGDAAPQAPVNLNAYSPAGYIILKGAEGRNGEHAAEIVRAGIPLVGQGVLHGVDAHAVCVDNRYGMKLAAEFVIERGHRRLGYISGLPYSTTAKERKLGFIESLVEHDIPVPSAQIADLGETATAGYCAALEMLRGEDTRPTAIVCFNDMVAMGVYRAAHELGLDIPGDVSVVGFDGVDFSELFAPPLTTVDIGPYEQGRQAADLLLRAIRGETGPEPVREWVEPKLVERDSVRVVRNWVGVSDISAPLVHA